MAFDFPNSPAEGQVYSPPGGPSYVYKSPRWVGGGAEVDININSIISPVAPSPPLTAGQLWFNSSTGNTYIWYDDGNSQQWVQINAGLMGGDIRGMRSLLDWIDPDLHAAIQDGSSTADVTVSVKAAFDSGEHLYMPHGVYNIADMVSLQNQRSIHGDNRVHSRFMIHSDFNMGSQGVIKVLPGESNASIRDLGIEFEQPSFAGMTRADLIHYPPALYGVSAGRLMLDNFRVTRGWDGLNLSGNAGGLDIGTLEVGVFNRGLFMDGALDWVLIDTYRFWAYGIPASGTPQGDIFRDGTTIAMELGRVDGLTIDKACIFRGNVVIRAAASSSVSFRIGNLMLDSAPQLLMEGGSLFVAEGYSSNGADTPHSVIVMNNSQAQLYLHDFEFIWSSAAFDAIIHSAGRLVWKGGRVTHYAPDNRLLNGTGGRLTIKDVELGAYSATRSVPFIETSSNYVDISNNFVDETVTGSPEMIRLTTDGDMVKVQNNRLSTGLITNPVGANLGIYGPNGTTYVWTPTLVFDTMGDAVVTYTDQLGRYGWDSTGYFYEVRLIFSMNAFTTAAGFAYIIGLPSLGRGISGMPGAIASWSGIDLDAGRTQVTAGYSTSTASDPRGRIVLSQTGDNLVAIGLGPTNIKPSAANVVLILSGYVRTRI